jgi:hypothetical protein
MRHIEQFAVSLLLVTLAGCASTGCDPSRAGFFEGIACSGGGYQQREAVLSQGLAQAQANALAEQANAAQAASSASAAQASLAARQRDMARLDANLADLRRRLKAAATRYGSNQEAIRRISYQMDALAHQQEVAKADLQSADMHALEDRQRQLVKLLDDLN